MPEPQHQSRGNTTISPEPPRPKNRPCVDGCSREIEPVFEPPVEVYGRILGFSNKWVFRSERCDICLAARRLKEQAAWDKFEMDRREKALLALLLPKGYDQFKFETFQVSPGTKEAFEACKAFDPEKESLYLWGPAGCGKSHLAGATVRMFFSVKEPVFLLKHGALNRSMHKLGGDEYDEKMAGYVDARVFCLDDLGTARQTDFADQVAYDLIDARDMNNRHGLIVTSNLSIQDLAMKLGDDRLPSRLAGMCRVIRMEASDRRLEVKTK